MSTAITPTIARALMRAAGEAFIKHRLGCRRRQMGVVCVECRQLEGAALDAADLYVTAVGVVKALETVGAMSEVERARDYYQFVCWAALVFKKNPKVGLEVDAASIELDMAVAEHFSGRHPRLWSKEIPA